MIMMIYIISDYLRWGRTSLKSVLRSDEKPPSRYIIWTGYILLTA